MSHNDRRGPGEVRQTQAQILPFRPRHPVNPPPPAVPVAAIGAWYHEAAVREAEPQDRKR